MQTIMNDDGAGGCNTQRETHHKRRREEEEDDDAREHPDHAGAATAATLFYPKVKRSLVSRANSRIYHLRCFNNWVKATQIRELEPKTTSRNGMSARSPLRVLDLACGKGGDLGKWILHHRGISNYVGIDVAEGSLKHAAIRARNLRHKLGNCTLTCADLGVAVPGRLQSPSDESMQKLPTWSLQNEPACTTGEPEFREVPGGGVSPDEKFDIVSIQFAIHYMMSTKTRARRFFRTVSELLEIGGNLIATTIDARVLLEHIMNSGIDLHVDESASERPENVIKVGGGACRIAFPSDMLKRLFHAGKDGSPNHEDLFGIQYNFKLMDGSDHAAGVGDAVNLPEWLAPLPVLKSLAEEVGLELEYAYNFHEFFSHQCRTQGDVHHSLSKMKVLNRNGSISKEEYEISRLYVALKFTRVRETVPVSERNAETIDHEIKTKMIMALKKAKKDAGTEAWSSLSNQEKTRLRDAEFRKLTKE